MSTSSRARSGIIALALFPAIVGIGCLGQPGDPGSGFVSLTITPRLGTLAVGEKTLFLVSALDEADSIHVDFDPNWALSNSAVARIDLLGFATGILKGQTYIVARFGGRRDSVLLTVLDSVDLARHVAIAPAVGSLLLGATRQYQAVVRDSLGQTLPVLPLWSVSDSALASITAQGVLTALQVGMLSVTARAGLVQASVPLTIIAPAP